MNNFHKRKRKQMYMTAIGIFCVALLFVLALIFPKYYYQHYDNDMLNRVTYTDIHVDSFEVSYDSFVEKLHVITKMFHTKGVMQAVRVSELGAGMNKASLTKIANQELSKLRKQNVLVSEVKLKRLKKKELVSYERYVFCGSVSCWRLVYENDNRRVTLYLDEEYHKIYYLEKSGANSSASNHSGSADVPVDLGYEVDGYRGSYQGYKSLYYNWWEGMLRYYNFSYQDDNICLSKEESEMQGYIIFENQYELLLYNDLAIDMYGDWIWRVGIPIDKMIQF